MKKRTIVTTAAAATLAATLVIGGTFAYLTDSTEAATNTFAENGNSVDLDETTGSDYEIVPGTEQEKDPTITATYTLDSYVYVQVTDETEGLVEWYIANGWSELDSYDDVYAMELRTIYDAETWTLVEDEGSAYYGQYTYTDDNGVVYYYNAGIGEYTAIIPVLKDNKVSYSADLTNEDITVDDSLSLSFQAYIMQADGFDSAEDAYYECIVTKVTVEKWTQVSTNLKKYDPVEIIYGTTLDGNSQSYNLSGGDVTINTGSYGTAANTRIIWTSGTLTLKGSNDSSASTKSLSIANKSNYTLLTASGENAGINIESGVYAYEKTYGTLVKTVSGGCINVNGGVFQFTKTTGTTGNIFLASNGSIYVNAVDGIEASNSNGVLNIFSASGEGVIYVEANLYEELVSTYNVDGSKVQVLADGCTAVLDEASEYYVIKAE